MRNLIRMDLYRMRKARGFWVMLILAFFFGLVITPFEEGFAWLVRISGDDPEEAAQAAALLFSPNASLSDIIANPFPLMNAMLMFLSAFIFFGADTNRGYIRNVISLMPSRAHYLLAMFAAVLVHNALFMLAGMAGNLIGTAIFRQIVFDELIWRGILAFVTKYILALGLTALIMLLTVSKGNKGLGIITCVLLGCRMLMLLWQLIGLGLMYVLRNESINLLNYMPDQLLYAGIDKPASSLSAQLGMEATLKQPYGILLAVGLLALLLPLAVRVFKKRDL